MTCSEARQYIFAFLDNELDAAHSLEVQQHIEHCPLCARECEIENVARRQLAQKLQEEQPAKDVPAFDESALTQLLRSGQTRAAPVLPKRPRHWKLGAASAIAAALLFAVTVFVATAARQTASPTLPDALVDDFDHFVRESKPLQIVSADAEQVSAWLRDQTALAVSLPFVDRAKGTLLGGRKCTINGAPAAFAVYRVDGGLVSVVALAESKGALTPMKRVDLNGHTHWVDHCRDHTVLACRRGELIYAVVSRLSEESLSPLMPPDKG